MIADKLNKKEQEELKKFSIKFFRYAFEHMAYSINAYESMGDVYDKFLEEERGREKIKSSGTTLNVKFEGDGQD